MPSNTLLTALCTLATLTAASAQSGTATYRLTFTSTWSAQTHPIQFPGASAHYSPLIGATHRSTASFWQPGMLASPGIKNMAETGSTSPLSTEIQAQITAGTTQQVLAYGQLNSTPGVQVVTFTAAADFPLLTLVTMVAPSPDWFVGVHGLNLVQNGDWVEQLTVPLQVYDAGTDSGSTHNPPNQPTVPPVPIAPVTTASGPFLNLPGPIGTFALERLHSTLAFGCSNPAGSLSVTGNARIGQTLTFGIDDPSNLFPSPAVAGLSLSNSIPATFPCGTMLPGFGLPAGQPGEVLLGSIDALVTGPQWTGPTATISLPLPMQMNLVGQRFLLQGLLASSRIGLTNGVAVRIGS